jgi:lysophospholipase L1-like esterase
MDDLLLTPADPRLGYWAPQAVDRTRAEVRLDRFPATVAGMLTGQIGPLANLRSSSGCAVVLMTDAPWIELRLDRLRHHQGVPQAVALEAEDEDGRITVMASEDLREREGTVSVRLFTGAERGAAPRRLWCWLPTISTAAVAGVLLPAGSVAIPPILPEPQWLALGDSLTQGFSVCVPTQSWVHRCARRWQLPVWNLGIGGLRIETEVFRWALQARTWPLVTIALGSNHAWRDSDAAVAGERAAALAEVVLAGGHGRVVWLLPPWKPCEAGQGPADFAGIPLDRAAGERIAQVRTDLRAALAPWRERIAVVEDLGARDARLYPDGLHPLALGAARYADQVDAAIRRDVAGS